ncbi:MAG: flavodoxin [Selenomonadaceae bacterium]|nr:flavodoxin [Selenomonadaceae bacterium]
MAKKTLIAYFSIGGTTARVAKFLSNFVEGDIYEIKAAQPYSKKDLDWHDKTSRSTVEMQDTAARPAIDGTVPNMEEYEVIFVGFPIWWYLAPRIINTFLESYDLSGKIVVPFCTSGGSDVGKTNDYLQPSCEGAVLKPARCLNKVTRDMVSRWLDGLKL